MTEPEFFREEGFEDLMECGLASCDHLVKRLDAMFLEYVMGDWVPDTLRRLLVEKQRLQARSSDLGSPSAFDAPLFTSSVHDLLGKGLSWMVRQQAQVLDQMVADLHDTYTLNHLCPVNLEHAEDRIGGIQESMLAIVWPVVAQSALLLRESASKMLAHDTCNCDFVGTWKVKGSVKVSALGPPPQAEECTHSS